MNRIRIIGMMDAESEITKQSSPSDFSDDHYDGMSLYRHKDMKPVVLFVSKNAEPARWKVVRRSIRVLLPLICRGFRAFVKCAATSS